MAYQNAMKLKEVCQTAKKFRFKSSHLLK